MDETLTVKRAPIWCPFFSRLTLAYKNDCEEELAGQRKLGIMNRATAMGTTFQHEKVPTAFNLLN